METYRPVAQRLMQVRRSFAWRVALKGLVFLGQFLFLLLMIRAESRAQLCTGEPLRVDEAVGWLHARSHPTTTQDRTELGIVIVKERVSGIAEVQVDVDTGGHVIGVTPISGPRQLISAYRDEAKETTFYPFQRDGQPVCARFTLKYAAALGHADGPDAKTKEKFVPLFNQCSALSATKSEPEALHECQLAAEEADKLVALANNRNRVAAYTYYASALILANRPKEALAYADKAVAICDLGFVDVSDKATAYSLRGEARALTGDAHGASEDLAKAEELGRAMLEVPRTPEQRKYDSGVLRSTLIFHAQILAGSGNAAEAEKLRDEARRL